MIVLPLQAACTADSYLHGWVVADTRFQLGRISRRALLGSCGQRMKFAIHAPFQVVQSVSMLILFLQTDRNWLDSTIAPLAYLETYPRNEYAKSISQILQLRKRYLWVDLFRIESRRAKQ